MTRGSSNNFNRASYPRLWSRGNAPQAMEVAFAEDYERGSVVIDHSNQYAYVMMGNRTAWRFPIVVGLPGHEMRGNRFRVEWKEENPTWQAPAGDRSPNPFAVTGPTNPLGSFAFGLVTEYGVDEGYRMHGTNRIDLFDLPDGARKGSSGGCLRWLNNDIDMIKHIVPTGALVDVYYNNEVVPYVTPIRPLSAPPQGRVVRRSMQP